MLRRVFKRRFALIMVCMILVGVLTPASTFAKTSKEKSTHSSHPPKVTIRKSPKTGKKDPVATIQEGCPPSAPINATPFNAGDIVTLTATLTSPDPDEASEAPEPLNIFDTNGNLATPAAPKVVGLNKTASFTFTASAGDQLEACIVGYDGDETGTITFDTIPHPVAFRIAKAISDIIAKSVEISGPPATFTNGFIFAVCGTLSTTLILAGDAELGLESPHLCVDLLKRLFTEHCRGVSNSFHCFVEFVQEHKNDIIRTIIGAALKSLT